MFFNRNKPTEIDSFESEVPTIQEEYKDLLVKYTSLIETLNLVDSASERFDAVCLELQATNHRIAAIKKELLEIQR